MKNFLYFLLTEDGRSYTVKNGVVTASNQPVALPNTPDGWQDISIGWERDMKSCGVIRNFSLSLGFVLSGATILRKVVYDGSIEEKVFLFIARRHTDVNLIAGTFRHLYRKFYKGQLDLSTYQDEAFRFGCAISEGGLKKKYDAYRGTAFEFPLSEGDVWVKHDGLRIAFQKRYLCPAVSDYTSTCQAPFNLDDTSVYAVAFSKIAEEGSTVNLAALDQQYTQLDDDLYLESDAYFLAATGPVSLRAELSFSMTLHHNLSVTGGYCKIQLVKSTGEVVASIADFDIESGVDQKTFSYKNTVDFTMADGEKLFLVARLRTTTSIEFVSIPAKATLSFTETECGFFFKARYRVTTIRGYTPFRLFQKLVGAITGSEANAASELLLQYDDYILTSGDGVRGLEGAKIKTTLNDFCEAFHTIAAAGWGIENSKIRMEEKGHFLDNSNPIELGEVKNLEVSPAKDLLFNTVKVGYNEIQTDDVNGRFAFNNTHLYKTVVTNVAKELALISPYAADPFAIELTRINLEGKTTTDGSSDNQVFVINTRKQTAQVLLAFELFLGASFIGLTGPVDLDLYPVGATLTITGTQFNNKTFTIKFAGLTTTGALLVVNEPVINETVLATVVYGTRILNRPPGLTITGVPDPATVFNVLLSPKRILLRHLLWINSVLHDLVGTKLTFQTTEKNADLRTVEGAVTIEEKADVTVGTARLFKAVHFSFDAPAATSIAEILETEPNRSFRFSGVLPDGGRVTFTGFSQGIGVAPNDEREQKLKLLSTPDNNLLKLIR